MSDLIIISMCYVCYTSQTKIEKSTSTLFYQVVTLFWTCISLHLNFYMKNWGPSIEPNQTETFWGRLVVPVTFESLLFCNSLQHQSATNQSLEEWKPCTRNSDIVNPVLHYKAFIWSQILILPNGGWNGAIQWIVRNWPAMENNLPNKAIDSINHWIQWPILTSHTKLGFR
jgi:hypothetical protein